MDSRLTGWHVLVTGASGGIGSATARAMAAEGAHVGLHFHSGREAAREVAGSLPGGGHALVGADLRAEDQTDALFAGLLDAWPRIDAVVVNAGVWETEDVPLAEMSLVQWEGTLASDLTSAFLTCRGFLRHLEAAPRDEASIVLVGSTAAVFGEAGHADYAAAKAALSYGLNRTLKNEIVRLAPRGRVNAVCPGWTATPLADDALADTDAVERVTATMALRKIATPEDIASAIVWLTSPALAGHVSGSVVTVAGGMEGRLLHPPVSL